MSLNPKKFILQVRLFLKEFRPPLVFLFVYYILPRLYFCDRAVHLRGVITSSPLFVPALKNAIQGLLILSIFNIRQRRVSPPIDPHDYDSFWCKSAFFTNGEFVLRFQHLNRGKLHSDDDYHEF